MPFHIIPSPSSSLFLPSVLHGTPYRRLRAPCPSFFLTSPSFSSHGFSSSLVSVSVHRMITAHSFFPKFFSSSTTGARFPSSSTNSSRVTDSDHSLPSFPVFSLSSSSLSSFHDQQIRFVYCSVGFLISSLSFSSFLCLFPPSERPKITSSVISSYFAPWKRLSEKYFECFLAAPLMNWEQQRKLMDSESVKGKDQEHLFHAPFSPSFFLSLLDEISDRLCAITDSTGNCTKNIILHGGWRGGLTM